MQSKWIKIIVALNLLLVLGLFYWQVAVKEDTLKSGKMVYLQLAPRDPRSLMQGDYMDLNYEILNTNFGWLVLDSLPSRGFCIVRLNDSSVAQFVRVQQDGEPLAERELKIKYFRQGRSVSIGAESYFFEEGTGKAFELTRYGGLRVDENGNSILVGLFDDRFKKLEAADSIRVPDELAGPRAF